MRSYLFSFTVLFFLLSCCRSAFAQGSLIEDLNRMGLKEKLDSVQIIGLGETGHGYASINDCKSSFINKLAQDLSFKVIVFESTFTGSITSYLNADEERWRTRSFLYPFWNTAAVNLALKPFFNNEKAASKPLVAGFDIQEDCRFYRFSKLLVDKRLVTIYRQQLMDCDSILYYYIGEHYSRKVPLTANEYILLCKNYDLIAKEIYSTSRDALQSKLLARSIQNRKWLCQYLTLTNTKEKMFYRDSLMADNILWLQKELYDGEKMIAWAADVHVAKKTGGRNSVWMGERLSGRLGKNYFSVSIQKGTSSSFSMNASQKFDMVIYLQELKKIKTEDWKTPCKTEQPRSSFIDSISRREELTAAQIKTYTGIDSIYFTGMNTEAIFRGDTAFQLPNGLTAAILKYDDRRNCIFDFLLVFNASNQNTDHMIIATDCDQDESADFIKLDYKFEGSSAFQVTDSFIPANHAPGTKKTVRRYIIENGKIVRQ